MGTATSHCFPGTKRGVPVRTRCGRERAKRKNVMDPNQRGLREGSAKQLKKAFLVTEVMEPTATKYERDASPMLESCNGDPSDRNLALAGQGDFHQLTKRHRGTNSSFQPATHRKVLPIFLFNSESSNKRSLSTSYYQASSRGLGHISEQTGGPALAQLLYQWEKTVNNEHGK